jgi:YHS domain-containing protein
VKITVAALVIAVLSLASCKPAKPDDVAGESSKPYPLETCLISGEKLGEMGEPYEIVFEGRQLKFCCKKCLPDFQKDPAKYLEKLN